MTEGAVGPAVGVGVDVVLGRPGVGFGPAVGVGDNDEVVLRGPGVCAEVRRGAKEVVSLQSSIMVEPLPDVVPPGHRVHDLRDIPPSESL